MSTLQKLTITGLLMLVLTATSLSPALAKPNNGLNDWNATITCGGETFNFVFPPGGHNPIIMLSPDTRILLETEGTVTATGFNLVTQEWVTLTFEFQLGSAHGKALGLEDKLETCTYHFDIPDGYFQEWSSVVNDVVVKVHRTPTKP